MKKLIISIALISSMGSMSIQSGFMARMGQIGSALEAGDAWITWAYQKSAMYIALVGLACQISKMNFGAAAGSIPESVDGAQGQVTEELNDAQIAAMEQDIKQAQKFVEAQKATRAGIVPVTTAQSLQNPQISTVSASTQENLTQPVTPAAVATVNDGDEASNTDCSCCDCANNKPEMTKAVVEKVDHEYKKYLPAVRGGAKVRARSVNVQNKNHHCLVKAPRIRSSKAGLSNPRTRSWVAGIHAQVLNKKIKRQ